MYSLPVMVDSNTTELPPAGSLRQLRSLH